MGSILRFMHPSTLVTKDSVLYRPPSFPPPNDWPVTIDVEGNPLSLFKDDYWNMNAFGFYGYDFRKLRFSDENKQLLKHALIFVMYHPQVFPGRLQGCRGYFSTLCRLIEVCDRNRILISDIHRFPNLFFEFAKHLQCSRMLDRIAHLHKLNLYHEELGFGIGGKGLLQVLSREAQHTEIIQHPYIPPRLWSYQVNRLNEALDDFDRHRERFEKAFMWLHHAYVHNRSVVPDKYQSPFSEVELYRKRRIVYDGGCNRFLEEYGLLDLFKRWIDPENKKVPAYSTLAISKYLSLIRDISIIYILNFSMQRKSEATSLRSDCFKIEHDVSIGNICTIKGETTKTDPDCDARWVVPECVKKAVDLATWIAKLRLRTVSDCNDIPNDIRDNPYLLSPACELWSSRGGHEIKQEGYRSLFTRFRRTLDYSNVVRRGSNLFEEKELLVTEEDARIALAMTPNLYNREWFGIGKPWNFTTHQARRTLAVNMFASSRVSLGSIQHQMKHYSRNMTLYYGRNYANIHLDSKVQRTLIAESYASVYRKLVEVAEDEVENVRPHGTTNNLEALIELVDADEEKRLTKLVKAGEVGCRKTLLGFCMKTGSCEYGGIESISKCAGGDRKGICVDAIFVRKNKEKLLKLKRAHEEEIDRLDSGSMRYGALKQEMYAIEVYLNVTDR